MSMSYYHKKPNSMHTSQIIYKHQDSQSPSKGLDSSKFSHLYTKATSQIGSYDNHQYTNLVQNYENRLKNMQIGFQRSKQQFENTLRQMYRQKIILLNIISHNQELVDEFRNKVRMNPQGNFKEVETKYNIISSGLFHNQLCSNCVLKISKAETQSAKSSEYISSYKTEEKQKIKKHEKAFKKNEKSMSFSKQYSWMYTPTQDFRVAITKLKQENTKLRNSIQEHIQQSSFKMNEKNRQIQCLKSQISKIHHLNSNKVHTNHPKQTLCLQSRDKCHKNRQLLKFSQKKHQQTKVNKVHYEQLIKDLNDKIMMNELQRLNSKYRGRCF